MTSDRRARLKALERGNKQRRQANGILRKASAYFAPPAWQDATDLKEIKRVHDESKGRYGARKVWHRLRREGKVSHAAL